MKTIANIILAIFAITFVAICGIIQFQVSQIWGTNNEMGLLVAFGGGILVLVCAFNGAATIMSRDWRSFAAVITFLVLGWGTVIGSNFVQHSDLVAHTELSALLFVVGLIFSPAIAAAVAGEE